MEQKIQNNSSDEIIDFDDEYSEEENDKVQDLVEEPIMNKNQQIQNEKVQALSIEDEVQNENIIDDDNEITDPKVKELNEIDINNKQAIIDILMNDDLITRKPLKNEELIKAKNKYTSQLNAEYKQKMNLRFMYGKQFRSMMKHLETGYKIDAFLRYILNNTDNNKSIKEGFRATQKAVTDWIHHHEQYERDSFQDISTYIQSLFVNNDKTLEEHYQLMTINPKDKYKGIYLYECEAYRMEEFIIKLFWDKLTQLPMAQNVLITSKETSEEEIQAFFHRSILCNYNTLFVVEINDSFSEQQQGIMNTYIDQLLSYKNKEEKYDKSQTKEYLDSCILFIYGKEYKNNITSLLKQLNKLKNQNFETNDIEQATNKNRETFLSELGNIKIFTSEICGLGKTGKIKKLVNDNLKKYFHFLFQKQNAKYL